MNVSSAEAPLSEVKRKPIRSEATPGEAIPGELVELQRFMHRIYSELDRYETDHATYEKYNVDRVTRFQLRDVVEAKLEAMSVRERADWKRLAESLDGKFSPIIHEAREADKLRQRMSKLREWHQLDKIDQCDNEIMDILAESGLEAAEQLELRKKLEVLKTGEEVGRKILSDDATNAPTRRFLKIDEETSMVAYGKERFHEAAFKVGPAQKRGEKGEVINYLAIWQQRYEKETNEFYWEEIDPYIFLPQGAKEEDPEQARKDVESYLLNLQNLTSAKLGESVRELIGGQLGVSPDEVSYANEEINARAGVLPGEMMVREWAMSRIDLLLRFGVVPLTVIRPEKDGHDVASVQEGVASKDGRFPAREWLDNEAIAFFQTDPAKWAENIDQQTADKEGRPRFVVADNEPARSLMRAAVLACLAGEMDGITRNHIIDPITKKLSKIDSGLSQGVATGEWLNLGYQILNPATGKMQDAYHLEKMRSMPLEIALNHELELDEEAHDYMRELYKELCKPDSKQRKFLLSVMEVVFHRYGKVMAEKKLEQFLHTMNDIVLNGRPTQLEKNVHYSIEIEEVIENERLEREKRRQAQKKN